MVQVVSAVFGEYDQPNTPLTQSVPCSFTLLTDHRPEHTDGWNEVVVPHKVDPRHPRTVAKEPKLRPWRYCRGEGPWIWLDASFEITSPTFVEEVLAASRGHAISQWAHPWRDCIYMEANESAKLPKYRGVPVIHQAAHYHDAGHPVRWGMWATGLIVYWEPLDYLADLWWAEMNRWGFQDQISQPVALRHAGLRPHTLPYGLHQGPWLRWHPHVDENR
jgi:hypothetical protein